MKNIAVLFSGGGTDFQSLIDGEREGRFNGRIVVSVCSNHKAFGITRAKNAGIDCHVCSLSDYADGMARDRAIAKILDDSNVDLVVLAGYLGIVTSALLDKYAGRIINIHPALLPKFGGKGMYGLNVHKAVIAAGEKVSGATVHYVDGGTDTGEIIMQRELSVLPGDTPESLQQRILNEIEHKLLVEAVAYLTTEK